MAVRPPFPGCPEPASPGLRLVRVEGFEPACGPAAGGRDDFLRRFSVLLVDDACARRGGLGRVTHALNARGESFAVKTLALPGEAGVAGDPSRHGELLARAFDEEYEAHCRLSGLRGLPRLYGRGLVDGSPALIMEWVTGETLEHAARALAVDDEGRLSPLTAARLARDLFDLVASMGQVEGGFAHRDLSPANVMVCTAHLSLADQVEEGAFDLRVIDFGSSALADRRDTSLTEGFGTPRRATPDYAPPEMLTDDVPQAPDARVSPAVDVYAAAGIAYRLASGRPPFDLGAQGEVRSPYRRKTEDALAPLVAAHGAAADPASVLRREPELAAALGQACLPLGEEVLRAALEAVDSQLGDLILPCLAVDQAARPSAADVRDGLAEFCRRYAGDVRRALAGEPPRPAALTIPAR